MAAKHARFCAVVALCLSLCGVDGLRQFKAALQNNTAGLRSQVPHDQDVSKCDPKQPLPPVSGKFSEFRYNLYPGARVIVDIGGNVGKDIERLLEAHPAVRIFSFEPTPEYFSILQDKFGNDKRVNISNVGASNENGVAEFIYQGNHGVGTTGLDSAHTHGGEHVLVNLQDIDEILKGVRKEIGSFPDVLNVNCEGCEYAVMQRIADQGWIKHFRHIQLSWHTPDAVTDRVAKRCKIEEAVRKTHDLVWFGGPGWMAWQRRRAEEQ